ncbi:MAG: peptidylprolyl isomerase [Bacteroidales bacterium]|nr:peptidylprolyl isomerase [Bacteroidales bacterium]
MRRIVVCLLALTMTLGAQAQQKDDPVMFEINGKKIVRSEFMKEFMRSAGKEVNTTPGVCTYEKRQALEEYVELFVNYRTKLEDAYALRFDTLPDLVRELDGYRTELAAPYLIDSATLQEILHEAYERNHYTLHAAHILVRVKNNAAPEDTLAAYQEAMEYYNRVTTGGEDFLKVAVESASRRLDREGVPPDDPRRKDNGDVGNFNVFDMVYPFESGAYGLAVGEISKPVRTRYGYHIIKLLEKNAFMGKTTFQHIWIATTPDPEKAAARAQMAYKQLENGDSFSNVCLVYSDDASTADKGGLLSNMSVQQIPAEYVATLSKMEPGQVTLPFQTSYGWHILLLVTRDSLPPFEDMVPYYKQRLSRDSRSERPRSAFIEQSKKRYHFVDYTQTPVEQSKTKGKKSTAPVQMMASLDQCRSLLNDSVFMNAWHVDADKVTDKRPLFAIGDKQYTTLDLLRYMESQQRAEKSYDMDTYIKQRYEQLVNKKVLEYADSRLETEHKEFAELMDEYRNGLMIFSYNDRMIWSKAIRDTAALDAFYNRFSKERSIDNEEDAPYFWNERAVVTHLTIADSAALKPAKAIKLMEKGTKKQWTLSQLNEQIAKAINSDNPFQLEELTVEQEHQNLLKKGWWKPGVYGIATTKGYELVRVDRLIEPCLKTRAEARGFYINEFQVELEQQLLENLRKKYNVIIHQDVIDETTF